MLPEKLEPLRPQPDGVEMSEARDVSARPRETADDSARDRVGDVREHDRNRVRGAFCGERRNRRHRDDHLNFQGRELGGEFRQALEFSICRTVINDEVAAFGPSEVAQRLAQHVHLPRVRRMRSQVPDARYVLGGLCARGQGRHRQNRRQQERSCEFQGAILRAIWRSCMPESIASAVAAPSNARNISACVSHGSPWVPRNS